MIIVIVHHWCKPGMVEAARRRVDENGDLAASAAGLLFRYRLERPEEPLRISTVSAWTSREAYRAADAVKKAKDAANPLESPYERALNEIFEVANVHGDLPAALAAV
jgi:heme-degrading monooxygenase HmoA